MYCIISAKTGRLATSQLFETREKATEFAEQNIGIEWNITRTEYDEQVNIYNQCNEENEQEAFIELLGLEQSDQWKEDFGGEDNSQ